MKILSIETSCDETAVSIVLASGGLEKPHFQVLGNALFSQIHIHKEYGGVFPMLAKREHGKNFPPLLLRALAEAGMDMAGNPGISAEAWSEAKSILAREDGVYEHLHTLLEKLARPDIDVIAVTSGPGLEPALWVGISCALALGKLWNIPVLPANHMEGHIASVLMNKTEEIPISKSQIPKENKIQFPALALLVSGGHTELVHIEKWGAYKVIGQTRDDAVGEAFDKAARMMGLPYPGGPEISRLAAEARESGLPHAAKLPRPMIHSDDLDFSFSGLKTAVLYYIRDHGTLSEDDKKDLAREFEDAAVDVLVSKTRQALDQTEAQTLIVAGGVISNKKLREAMAVLGQEYRGLQVKTPTAALATDNAVMIACAAYLRALLDHDALRAPAGIIAQGNLHLGQSIH
jgi:N6-L-threonylcarbamoyladenine synthase